MNQSPHYFGHKGSAVGSVAYDQGLRAYFQKIYSLMGLGLLLSGAVAYAFYAVPALTMVALNGFARIAIVIAQLAIVWVMASRVMTMTASKAQMLFWVFCALNGSTLSVMAIAYQGESIARVFLITASLFGSMSIYGYVTKKNLMGIGNYLFMALVGVVIAGLVNLFLQSSAMQYILSFLCVGIFTGLTAYDTQQLKIRYDHVAGTELEEKIAIHGALTLYLDFINLFIHLMHLLGNRRD